MVLTVSNQNYAGFGHIAYYWSPDWGDTWIGHPDNPVLAPGQFPDGVPTDGFQRTPAILIDEEYNRYIIAYNAGHDITQRWKRRTYLAVASRPPVPWLCGDVDGNEVVNVSDIVYLISFVFGDGPAPDPMEAGDVDCNTFVNVSDIVYLISFVFGDGYDPCDTNGDGVPDC
jgi:hypothetical protein